MGFRKVSAAVGRPASSVVSVGKYTLHIQVTHNSETAQHQPSPRSWPAVPDGASSRLWSQHTQESGFNTTNRHLQTLTVQTLPALKTMHAHTHTHIHTCTKRPGEFKVKLILARPRTRGVCRENWPALYRSVSLCFGCYSRFLSLFFKMSGTVVSGVSIIHVLDCAQVLILM